MPSLAVADRKKSDATREADAGSAVDYGVPDLLRPIEPTSLEVIRVDVRKWPPLPPLPTIAFVATRDVI